MVSFHAWAVLTCAFSLAYTWFEGLPWAGGECSCLMVLPWAVNTSPHTQFQKGLELSRQALIPPEWPLLPAKEYRPHTHFPLESPLCASAGVTCGLRAGGRAWEPDSRRGGSPCWGPRRGQAVWSRFPSASSLASVLVSLLRPVHWGKGGWLPPPVGPACEWPSSPRACLRPRSGLKACHL